jgi:hypothetical protein
MSSTSRTAGSRGMGRHKLTNCRLDIRRSLTFRRRAGRLFQSAVAGSKAAIDSERSQALGAALRHTPIVPVDPPAASVRPSGLIATLKTGPVPPLSVASWLSAGRPHS